MPRSKYPLGLDTSVEIPVVRDNILEVGSDALNSLRSAIFQIERTLGINPQGAVGNTVADRLNNALDGNGNIKKDALDRANLLSGPIVNSDVSKVAGIGESKLNLNFPTQLLQDEISILNSQIDSIVALVNDINITIMAHINTESINRHPGTAISIEGKDVDPSDTATMSLQDGDVQSTFEDVYNAHINYTGEDIDSDNCSHLANQVFFETSGSLLTLTDANDVQEVIEDLADSMLNFEINHQDLFHSNGLLRVSRSTLPDDNEIGRELIADVSTFFDKTQSDGNRISRVTIYETDVIDFNPEKSDIISLTDGDDEYELEIANVNISSDGATIKSIDVFGDFPNEAGSSAVGTVTRNINQLTSKSSLLAVGRERADETSASVIQIANPNAVAVISKNINPEAISPSNRFLDISVDGGTNISLDLYSSEYDRMTIDSLITVINEYCVENYLNILSYRVDIENKNSEIAFVCNLPDTDELSHTLKVVRGTDDAIDSMGFAHLEDKESTASYGSFYYINGAGFTGLGVKVDTGEVSFFGGERVVTLTNSDDNFVEYEVHEGDIAIIYNSSSDDGSYLITGVDSDTIELDSAQLPLGFTDSFSDGVGLAIYSNSISLEYFDFDKVENAGGAMLFDIFMNSEQNIFADKRLEYAPPSISLYSLIHIVDFDENGVDLTDLVLSISLTAADEGIYASLDDGDVINVRGKDSYIYLYSKNYNVWIKLFIVDTDLLAAYLALHGDHEFNVTFYKGVNRGSNLLLARVPYGNFKGRVFGGTPIGTTRVISKVEQGNIGINEISNEARNVLSERPLFETRANGVTRGLEIYNVSTETPDGEEFYTFDIYTGIAYVMGERFEIDSRTVITDINSALSDKFYIGIDEYGNIIFESADAYCMVGFSDSEVCVLGVIEYDGVTARFIDLRLFINDLDLKVLNSITVSPEPGMGHFSDVGKAIQYAKRFSDVFPKAGVPTIHLKSGVHKVVLNLGLDYAEYSLLSQEEKNLLHNQVASDAGFYINFPVNIIGEGHSTVLDAKLMWSDYGDSDDDRTGATSLQDTGLFIVGPGLDSSITPSGNTDLLTEGIVRLSNFRLRLTGVFPVCNITEDSDGNKPNYGIKLDNLTFDYSERVSFSTTAHAVYTGTLWPSSIDNLGNISIVGCNFLGAAITIGHDVDEVRNVNIIDNIFKGSGDGTVDGGDASYYAIRCQASGHIFSVIDCPLENNVNIVGNINADNDGTNIGYIDAGGDYPWGDRVSRNFIVGGSVGIGISTPDELLHVHSETGSARIKISTDPDNSDETLNPGIILEQDGGSTTGEIRLEGETGATYTGSYHNALCINKTGGSDNKVQIGASNSMVLTVTNDKVGVGTNDPDYELDVDGKARALKGIFNANLGETTYGGDPVGGSRLEVYYGNEGLDSLSAVSGLFTSVRGVSHFQTANQIFTIAPAITISDSHVNDAIASGPFGTALIHCEFTEPGRVAPEDTCVVIAAAGSEGDIFFKVSGNASGGHNIDSSFTGSHDTVCKSSHLSSGLIVESTGEVWGKPTDCSYETALPRTRVCSDNGSKSVFGVTGIDSKRFLGKDAEKLGEGFVDNNNFGGALKGCFTGFVKKFGIRRDEVHISAMAIGEGVVWVTNINGDIQNGDYIESSVIPGHGRLQDDDIMRSRTVAKCTESINWSSITDTIEYDGKLYKKYLTCSTFHCG